MGGFRSVTCAETLAISATAESMLGISPARGATTFCSLDSAPPYSCANLAPDSLETLAKTLTVSNGAYHEPIAPDKRSIRSSSLCAISPLKVLRAFSCTVTRRGRWTRNSVHGTRGWSCAHIGGDGRPCLHQHASQRDAADRFESFLQDNGVQILNVARPRASKEPSVAQFVIERFDSVFRF